MGPVLILAAWTIGSTTGLLNTDLFPPPTEVASTAWRLLGDGQLATHVGASAVRVLTGTVLGILIGVLLAVVAGLTRTGEDLLDWTMQILKAVPNFALTPLLIIWMGIGEGPKIVLITTGVAIAIYINTYSGIRGVDRQLVEMAQTLEAPRHTLIAQVILPGAMPNFLVGLRLGLSSAWLSLIFAEMINTTQGIGYLMSRAQTNLQFDVSLLVIVIYAVAGLLSYTLVRVLERLLLSWRNGFDGTAERRHESQNCGRRARPHPSLRRPAGARGPRIANRRRRIRRDAGPVRFRQEHPAARPGRSRRSGHRVGAGAPLTGGGVSEPAAAAVAAGAGQRDLRAARRRAGRAPARLARGRAALEEVGLTDKTRAWPLSLSGGEAQRVSLARALVREPDLLLLDEPFGALDALTRLKMYGLLHELWSRRHMAVLHVTHDVDEAILLADRVVVLLGWTGPRSTAASNCPSPAPAATTGFDDLRRALLSELGVREEVGHDRSR